MTQPMDHLTAEQVDALIDGELAPQTVRQAEEHLSACSHCALRVLSATQLKTATARARRRFPPPPDVAARLQEQLRPRPRRDAARTPWFNSPLFWAAPLAAAFLLLIFVFFWHDHGSANALSAELLDQHLATLSSASSPEVISTDRHTVKPWFQGRLSFSFNLPDAQALPQDSALQGADLAYLDGQPVALLLFTIHKHRVSVFVAQATAPSLPRTLPKTRSGFSMSWAATGDLHFIAVSDVNPADLDSVLQAVAKAN